MTIEKIGYVLLVTAAAAFQASPALAAHHAGADMMTHDVCRYRDHEGYDALRMRQPWHPMTMPSRDMVDPFASLLLG
ncbi:exported hypothetical protein [Bradyrhizobium sp. STM 3843]|uniref:hypothetical protein n=1 Tax=Bradyrhizobium sp. STM 3843 TaxID=551947 RepID=UPI00024055D7|nr:hypothetical protein [Bradyrhizobium sp. STM 3843]CCE11220.1 exported hypothetical protein [Bradyrhizobium sp. STM 3843]